MLSSLCAALNLSMPALFGRIASLAGVSIDDVRAWRSGCAPNGLVRRIVIAIACLEREAYALRALEDADHAQAKLLLDWREDDLHAELNRLSQDQANMGYNQAMEHRVELLAKYIEGKYLEDIRNNLVVFEVACQSRPLMPFPIPGIT